MKKAVIYARYSSERQNEQSIAGQVEVCTEWAKNNDIRIVHIYHDEALTGKTDRRPGFQQMIKDAKNGKFDYIIVYKLDRFARNRYDSAIYKAQLKKFNVRIMSAMENIADGPEGIILESVLEGMAEYYSANLAQNVLRGMSQRAECGKHLGGVPPLGYKVDENKDYVVDEETAPIVKKIFEMYASGETLNNMATYLNERGYTTSRKKKFNTTSFGTILKNKKYVGTYSGMDAEIPDATPKLIDEELFYKVQEKLQRNKRAPASNKSPTTFYLTGKLFCGKCGSSMVGDSGTSRTKTPHYYYSCIEKKRKHGCTKKSVKKEWLEQLIADTTMERVLTDENIKFLAEKAFEIYEKERSDNTEAVALKSTLNEVQKTIDNIIKAIEQGIITDTTKQRLLESEERKKALLASIAEAEIQKPLITKESIEFFLRDMRDKIYSSDERIEVIINTFVNAIYLYDDKLVITFNFREGEKLKKLELTDIEKFGFHNVTSTKKKSTQKSAFLFVFVSARTQHHYERSEYIV